MANLHPLAGELRTSAPSVVFGNRIQTEASCTRLAKTSSYFLSISVPMNSGWLLLLLHEFGANKVQLQPISRPHMWQTYIHWRVNYGLLHHLWSLGTASKLKRLVRGLQRPLLTFSPFPCPRTVAGFYCFYMSLEPIRSNCSPYQDRTCGKLTSTGGWTTDFCTICGLWEPHPNWSVLYAACKDLFLLSLHFRAHEQWLASTASTWVWSQ